MSQRTNLINKRKPTAYILGSILLWAMSGLGIIWIVGSNEEKKEIAEVVEEKISPTATVVPTVKIATDSGKISITPTTKIASATATLAPTEIEDKIFESETDKFRVVYENKRKLYQDTEESGNRYTFFHQTGNIAVHVGKKWSWINPGRTYSNTLLVDGVQSSVYEISNQKIVDFEKNDLKYTIQCIHNTKKELKEECEEFIKNFKFI